eukprot:symbB.v1.2.004982.t1/scaffold288.1/size478366/12
MDSWIPYDFLAIQTLGGRILQQASLEVNWLNANSSAMRATTSFLTKVLPNNMLPLECDAAGGIIPRAELQAKVPRIQNDVARVTGCRPLAFDGVDCITPSEEDQGYSPQLKGSLAKELLFPVQVRQKIAMVEHRETV